MVENCLQIMVLAAAFIWFIVILNIPFIERFCEKVVEQELVFPAEFMWLPMEVGVCGSLMTNNPCPEVRCKYMWFLSNPGELQLVCGS